MKKVKLIEGEPHRIYQDFTNLTHMGSDMHACVIHNADIGLLLVFELDRIEEDQKKTN